MRNLTWYQARHLAQQLNRPVRRWEWRRWVCWTGYYLWFTHIPPDSQADPVIEEDWHVVQAPEFTDAEFLANDWTDEPWNVPSDGLPKACPDGYQWDPWTNACVKIPVGTSPAPTSSTVPPLVPGEILPPDNEFVWGAPGNLPKGSGQGGFIPGPGPGGGGGGGGGAVIWPPMEPIPPGTGRRVNDEPNEPHAPPAVNPPVVNGEVAILEGDGVCFHTAEAPATVTLVLQLCIAGGEPGVGAVEVEGPGSNPTQVSSGWNGMCQTYTFPDVTYTPGGVITFTVTYEEPPIPPGVEHVVEVEFVLPPLCTTPI